jgi:hypothetical protein
MQGKNFFECPPGGPCTALSDSRTVTYIYIPPLAPRSQRVGATAKKQHTSMHCGCATKDSRFHDMLQEGCSWQAALQTYTSNSSFRFGPNHTVPILESQKAGRLHWGSTPHLPLHRNIDIPGPVAPRPQLQLTPNLTKGVGTQTLARQQQGALLRIGPGKCTVLSFLPYLNTQGCFSLSKLCQ